MILTCPSCATRYFADDASIGPNGRAVRCAACKHTWYVEARLDLRSNVDGESGHSVDAHREGGAMRAGVAQQAPHRQSSTAQVRALQAQRERRDRTNAAMLAWSATGVALVGVGVGAVAMRDQVVQVWPNSAGVYAAMGIGVNPFGLEIADLQVTQDYEGGETVYVVRGAIVNMGREQRIAPLLRFGLRDAQEAEIHAQLADLRGQPIPGGKRVTFEFRLDGPVDQAADLEATFETRTAAAEAEEAPKLGPAAKLNDAATLDGVLELAPEDRVYGAAPDGLAGRMDAAPATLGADLRG
jgi:predicted Zn finger-like uncharacterized protein